LSDRVIGSLHRQLAAETEASLEGQMAFPIHWDPYFSVEMTMRDLYHYATLHFDHHRRQLASTTSTRRSSSRQSNAECGRQPGREGGDGRTKFGAAFHVERDGNRGQPFSGIHDRIAGGAD
jgi:hypothetical protein